ncbi:MAG: hypothetical protein M3P15_04210, partial [Actinomycetota bacterium]|nr:hypothetical protein [Actinomycetota bacterium]
ETARMQFQQRLELDPELSDAGGQAITLAGLALVALAGGETDEAAALLRSSLRLANDIGAREFIFSCLLGSAEVAAQRRETVRAARLLAASDALCEEMGYMPPPLERAQRARIVTVLDADDAALVAARSEGRALTLDEAVAYALEDHDRAVASGPSQPLEVDGTR